MELHGEDSLKYSWLFYHITNGQINSLLTLGEMFENMRLQSIKLRENQTPVEVFDNYPNFHNCLA